MPEGPPPPSADVRRLLLEIVDSYEKLDVLLRLARAAGARVTEASLIDGSGPDPSFTIEAVSSLVESGLTAGSRSTGWTLAPDSAWAAAVHELARLHEADRVQVLNLMTTAALERLHGRTARAFADAFRLRLRKKGDLDG